MTRILVVEDEESYRDPLSYQLTREGYDVVTAATGPEALDRFAEHGADLVLVKGDPTQDITAMRQVVRSFRLGHPTGGPATYSGRDLAIAHARLGITPGDFDRVVEHLVGTLTSFGVSGDDIGTVGEALTAHRDEIVTAPAPA